MSKPKHRHGGGHKSRHVNVTSDIKKHVVLLPRADRHSRKRDMRFGFRRKHENARRGRLGKLLKDDSTSQLSFAYPRMDRPSCGPKSTSDTARSQPWNDAISNRNSVVPRRSSTATADSSLSRVTDVPWCEHCIHLNRQLRDYLFELFDTGRRAIDAWTCVAGVSLDHMDYERTKATKLPERLQRYSQVRRSCTANARCEHERQNHVIPTLPPVSSAGWSEGTLTGRIHDSDHLCGNKAVDDEELAGVSSEDTVPRSQGSISSISGNQIFDHSKTPPQASLHARWADNDTKPAQQLHNHFTNQQHLPRLVTTISQYASSTFTTQKQHSLATPLQPLQASQGDSPSRHIVLPQFDHQWTQHTPGKETYLEGGRVPPSVNDKAVICEATKYKTSGRDSGAIPHWAESEEMITGEIS